MQKEMVGVFFDKAVELPCTGEHFYKAPDYDVVIPMGMESWGANARAARTWEADRAMKAYWLRVLLATPENVKLGAETRLAELNTDYERFCRHFAADLERLRGSGNGPISSSRGLADDPI